MTAKQREVLDQVHELLTEHFEGHVYIVETENDDIEPNGDTIKSKTGRIMNGVSGGYEGGIARAMGLCLYQLEYLKRETFKSDEA